MYKALKMRVNGAISFGYSFNGNRSKKKPVKNDRLYIVKR